MLEDARPAFLDVLSTAESRHSPSLNLTRAGKFRGVTATFPQRHIRA